MHYVDGRSGTYTRGGSGEEDQCSQVSSTLVAQGTCGIDQGSNTVSLNGASGKGATPSGGSTGGFLGLEELFLGVGSLSAVVGIAEDGGQDSQGGSVGEDGTQCNSRGLNGGKV